MQSSRWALMSETSTAPPNHSLETTTTDQPATNPPTAEPIPLTDPNYTLMYAPDPSIDEFAHTRPPDDLFDDDFVPVDPETNEPDVTPIIEQPEPQPPLETPSQPSSQSKAPIDAPRGPRRQGGPPQRRGGGPTSSATTTTIPAAPATTTAAAPATAATATTSTTAATAISPGDAPTEATSDSATQEKSAASGEPARKEAPVRGDRSGTGGVRKAKLTEEELTAKLEAMKIKNAALVAAHEASVADAESFEAREAIATKRRREEGVKRRELMGEREKNRMRKLKAQGVREWDVGKEEREAEDRGFRKGMHGGVVGERAPRDQPRMEEREDGQREGGRREHRGGRGGRRGGHRDPPPPPPPPPPSQQQRDKESASQALPTDKDFPELPSSSGTKADNKTPINLEFPQKKAQKKIEVNTSPPKDTAINLEPISLEPTKEKRSWADQVESP